MRAAAVAEVADATAVDVELNGKRICLARVGDEFYALLDNCSHRDFPLSEGEVLPDGTIECAWHGARFCARTGVVMQGPATKPIAAFAVQVVDGEIWVGRG